MKTKKFILFGIATMLGIIPNLGLMSVVANESKIPIIEAVDKKVAGAAAREGSVNIPNSPYYRSIDFYNTSPTKTLVKLNKFKTYQQTSSWSCGAACAVMALNHFGVCDVSENALVKEMDTRSPSNKREDGSWGTTTEALVKAFKSRGFNVTSSMDTQKPNGESFDSSLEFSKFVISKLKENSVILVENVEFGGHWRVIVGYDDMGNPEDTTTHVLVFADPCDTNYHDQNGYTFGSVRRFMTEWFDHNVVPANQSIQQYVCISKKTEN